MLQSVAINSPGRERRAGVLEFIRSWSEDDAYDRFGVLGARQWLVDEMRTNDKRRAIVATIGKRIIGLLDHIESDGAVYIGVVVDAQFRGLHVATELVRELLREKSSSAPVAAECRAHNRAAIGLLRRCGFERVRIDRDEIVWSHP